MKRKYDPEGSRNRILSTCVRLFLTQGYSNTVPKQIVEEAEVATGTFYHMFYSKSAVLITLCETMFENQFDVARRVVGEHASGAMLYAVETSIQLALADLNKNLQEIYVEVYTEPRLLDLIQHKTSKELPKMFGAYLPNAEESDYYEIEIGTSALMRGYMARECDMYFKFDRKLELFLRMSLHAFNVPEAEIEQVVADVLKLDIRGIAEKVMHELFAQLEVKYDFKLTEEEK